MFRGEPIAYYTIIFGFISFLFVQLFGIFLSGVIKIDLELIRQSHWMLVVFGWFGLVILGAQLQFFRAITGLRRYEPLFLRKLFVPSLCFALVLMIVGNSWSNKFLVSLGLVLYFIGLSIQLYWLINQVRSKLFKFPLNYFIVSQLFLVGGLIFLATTFHKSSEILINRDVKFTFYHIIAIGWIGTSLHGAIIRILPMFLGQSIHRGYRKYLNFHFYFIVITEIILLITFEFGESSIVTFVSIIWSLGWIWTFMILLQSIMPNLSKLDYKITMTFFGPGLFWLAVGSILGILVNARNDFNINLVSSIHILHVHASFFAGLSLIMLGAIHRINAFQIYTLLYTGKRNESINLATFFRYPYIKIISVVYNLTIIGFLYAIYEFDYDLMGRIGIGIFSTTLAFTSILGANFAHYVKNKSSAIPFWLKSTEYKP